MNCSQSVNRSQRKISSTGAFLIGLCVLGNTGAAWGQRIAWTREFDGPTNFAKSVALDPSGSIYVAVTDGKRGVFLRKYEPNGQELWTRKFGAPGTYVNAVATDFNGNVFVAGKMDISAFIRKYDANGRELWTRQFSGLSGLAVATALAVDASGRIYEAGYIHVVRFGRVEFDAYIRMYDAAGNALWTRQFGNPGEDRATAVAADTSGSIYVAGNTRDRARAFLGKFDADGREVWTYEFNTSGLFSSVTTDNRGGVYVAGIYGFVSKYDSNGSELWTRQIGPVDFHCCAYANALAIDTSGVVYVAGGSYGTLPGQVIVNPPRIGGIDPFVSKYDSSGRELWTYQFASDGLNNATGVAVDASGRIYVVGGAHGGVPFLSKFVPCAAVPGDPNGDCQVDCQDIATIKTAFGTKLGQRGWYAPADVVTDNIIDVRDLMFVSQKLPAGTRCP